MSKYWKVLRIILPAVMLVWIVLNILFNPLEQEVAVQAPQKGFIAPDIELTSLDDGVVSLEEYRGNVIILNLWASWCPPCVSEMPAIQSVYSEYRDQGLTVLAVNMTFQDDQNDAIAFVEEQGLEFPILFDMQGQIAEAYNMYALPTTFFIDRDGIIQDVIIGGPMSEALLRTKAETLLERE